MLSSAAAVLPLVTGTVLDLYRTAPEFRIPSPTELPRKLYEAATSPLLLEPFDAAYQLARLLRDPIANGVGFPAGEEDPAAFFPGFGGIDDTGYFFLKALRHAGYKTFTAEIGGPRWYAWCKRKGRPGFVYRRGLPNVFCESQTGEYLVDRVKRIADLTGKPVTIVGHSLGGALAAYVNARLEGEVKHVFTAGSPLNGPEGVHWLLLWARHATASIKQRGGAHQENCGKACSTCSAFRMVKLASLPNAHKVTAIVGNDAVVDPKTSLKEGIEVINVPSMHLGLMMCVEVFQAIANKLHQLRLPQAIAVPA